MIKDDVVTITATLSFNILCEEPYDPLYSYMTNEEIKKVLERIVLQEFKKSIKSLGITDLEIYESDINFDLNKEFIDEHRKDKDYAIDI